MEENTNGRKRLTDKQNKWIKTVLIALLIVIAVPSAVGFGYMYYMAGKVDSHDIDDPIWDKPFEEPGGMPAGTGADLAPDEGETVTDDGYIVTDDGYVITEDGNYVTEEGEPVSEPADPGFNPASTDSLGIDNEVEKELGGILDVKNGKIRNILLLGVDSFDGRGRSDAIMILTIDQTKRQIKLSSIMRDSYVRIDGHGMDKINHAYAFGGVRLALKTINSNFRMNIKEFAVVNFSQLPKMVDAVGGIPMELSRREAVHMGLGNEGGFYQLSGAQALQFSRIRKIDSDFVRTSRQRRVLRAILSKLMDLPPSRIPGAADKLLPLIRTTMTANDIISTGMKVAASNYTVIGRVFPPESASRGVIIKGTWYLRFDRARQAKALHSFIFNQ